MAELIFKAFLSCSLAEEDKEIRDFFSEVIRSFDIEPLVYDYQEIGRVTDKVKEHIMQSDCVVAIVTRKQKIEDTDYWACRIDPPRVFESRDCAERATSPANPVFVS